MCYRYSCGISRTRAPYLSILAIIISVNNYGCTAQQIEYQALAHNQAFSASADKILLTNIVRSSRILPIDYTAVTEYKAKEVAAGSIIGKLPFGADALRAFNVDPSLNVGPGISSLDIKDFAQQKESFTKLHEDIEIQSFINLLDAGWNPRLVSTMLFQNVRVRGEFAHQLFKKAKNTCLKKDYEANIDCRIISESLKCRDNNKELAEILNYKKDKDPSVDTFGYWVNLGDDRCQFMGFQAVLSRLRLFRIAIDITSTKKITLKFTMHNDQDTVALKQTYDEVNEKLSGANRVALEFVGRSTHLMVKFLGQLARVQLFAPEADHWVPSIYLNEKKVPLFLIQRGDSTGVKMAISTEFDGETYGIPDPDYQDQPKHMSLYLFSYVRVRLDQAYAQTKLPPSNTLILR